MLKCLWKPLKPLKNFLQSANFSENTGLPQFFPKFFRQLYFKNINFLTKTKKCLLCWLLLIQNYQMTGKYLTSNTTFFKKVNPMKYRIQTYILVRTWIYYSCILLVYPIRPWNLLNVKKKTSNLIKVISCYNIWSGIKSQQAKRPFLIQYQKPLIFSEFLCSISSNHFQPFNFMCAFNW